MYCLDKYNVDILDILNQYTDLPIWAIKSQQNVPYIC